MYHDKCRIGRHGLEIDPYNNYREYTDWPPVVIEKKKKGKSAPPITSRFDSRRKLNTPYKLNPKNRRKSWR